LATRGIAHTVQFVAWDSGANAGKTGDGANFTLRWVKDGTSAALTTTTVTEIDSTNCPGLYKVGISSTESDCNIGTLAGKSSTSGVSVVPVTIQFERLPDAAPTAAGGVRDTYRIGGTTQTGLDLGVNWTAARAAKVDYLDAAVTSIPGVSAIADAVWDEPVAGHSTSGSTGASLSASGDPWSTTVPASYGEGTAGYRFGQFATSTAIAAALSSVGTVELIGPMLSGAAHKIVRGSAYLYSIETAPYVLVAKATYDLTGATAEFRMKLDRQSAVVVSATIVSHDASYWKVYANLTASNTDDMTPGVGHDQFWVTLSGGAVVCLSQNYLEVIAGINVS